MRARSILALFAAASLGTAPIAAQAGTRANDSSVSFTGMARQATPVAGSFGLGNHDDFDDDCDDDGILNEVDDTPGCKRIMHYLIFGVTGAVVLALILNDPGGGSAERPEGNRSPGTGG